MPAADGPPSIPEPFSWSSIAVAGYGPNLLYGVAEGAFLAVAVLAARDRGAGVALAGAVIVLFGLGSWLASIPAGRLVYRLGEDTSLFVAGILGAAAATMSGLTSSLPLYCVGAFALGGASSVVKLARQSYLAAVVPPQRRGLGMSIMGGVYRVGVFIGPVLGSWVIGRYGLSATFALVAAALIGSGVVGLRARGVPIEGADGTDPARAIDVIRAHRTVLATVGLGTLGVSFLRATRAVALPLWAEAIGLGAAETAAIFAISALVDVVLFIPAGLCIDRCGRRLVTVPAMALMASALLVLPWTHGRGPVAAVAVMLGFGNGMTAGIVQTLGSDYAPARARAPFLGVWRLVAETGSLAGPATVAAISALAGLAPALMTAGAVGLGAAAVMYRSLPPGRRAD